MLRAPDDGSSYRRCPGATNSYVGDQEIRCNPRSELRKNGSQQPDIIMTQFNPVTCTKPVPQTYILILSSIYTVVVEWLTLLLITGEVSGSNLGQATGYPY
jgi:hypothetical protein